MIAWLLHTAAAVSALLVAVLLLRRPVARAFGAGWAYALWAIPALRVIVPPLGLIRPDIGLPAAAQFIPAAAAGGTGPALSGPGPWTPFLLATWAGGAIVFLVLQWLAYRGFLRRLDGSARPARPPRYGGILTFISRAVDGPLALGLVRRRIVVPDDFSRRYSEGERRLALEHELTHHRRGDIWCNMAAMLLLAANWWNPLAWIAFRAFRADQELACDAAVAARASAAERCDYARAMVKSAARPGLIAACSMNGAGALKRRLRMMRLHRASGPRRAGGLAALGAFALTAFALGSPEARQAATEWVPSAVPTPAAAEAVAPPTAPVRLAARAVRVARPVRAAVDPRAALAPSVPLLAAVEPKLPPLAPDFPRPRLAEAPRPTLWMASAPLPDGARIRTARFVVTDAGVFATGEALSDEDRARVQAAVAEALRRADGSATAVTLARVEDDGERHLAFAFRVKTREKESHEE